MIGISELLILIIIATVVLGPEKIGEAANAIGKALKRIKEETNVLNKEINNYAAPVADNIIKPAQEIEEEIVQIIKGDDTNHDSRSN